MEAIFIGGPFKYSVKKLPHCPLYFDVNVPPEPMPVTATCRFEDNPSLPQRFRYARITNPRMHGFAIYIPDNKKLTKDLEQIVKRYRGNELISMVLKFIYM